MNNRNQPNSNTEFIKNNIRVDKTPDGKFIAYIYTQFGSVHRRIYSTLEEAIDRSKKLRG